MGSNLAAKIAIIPEFYQRFGPLFNVPFLGFRLLRPIGLQ